MRTDKRECVERTGRRPESPVKRRVSLGSGDDLASDRIDRMHGRKVNRPV